MSTLRTYLLIFAFIPFSFFAQDLPCTATSVTVNGGCLQGDNTGILYDLLEPDASCFTESHTVWMEFVATDDSMTVTTDFASLGELTLTDTQIAVFSSSDNTCLGTLTEIGCDDDSGEGCNLCSTLEFTTLTPGDTYFVMIDGYSSNVGTFCLSVFETPEPKPVFGASCEQAHQMYTDDTCFGSIVNGNQGDHTLSSPAGIDQSCSTEDDSAENGFWMKFIAADATVTFDPIDFTGSETANFHTISVYSGSCGAFTEVHCESTASKNNNFSVSGLTVGAEYHILITTGANYSGSLARLSICGATACSAPVNDMCANAIDISNGGTFTGTTACASTDKALCSGSTENNIWFSWTAPSDWPTDSAAFFYLWNQDCYATSSNTGGSQVSIYNASENCSTISGGSSECIVYTNPNDQDNFFANFIPTASSTYLINIDGFSGEACTFSVSMSSGAPSEGALGNDLITFNARLYNNDIVKLDWRITDNDFGDYIVERSSDGVLFEQIAMLSAGLSEAKRDGEGIKAYEFLDQSPLSGKSYYRLSKREGKRQFIVSEIVKIEIQSISEVNIVPNPVIGDSFELSLSVNLAGEHTIKIYNVQGKLLYSNKLTLRKGINSISIDKANDFPSGVLFMQINNENTTFNAKFIKS